MGNNNKTGTFGDVVHIVLFVLWASPGNVKSKTVCYGQHILRGDVITKMGKARKIAKYDKDIEGNYGGPYACEVHIMKLVICMFK
ncbi:hypothetical protein ACQ4LE_010279 [Meloidogyne hapla]